MKAVYLDEEGKEEPIVMGCYGIGIGRTAAAAIEQHHDDRGIMWPLSIAPFHVEIIPLELKGEAIRVAEELQKKLLHDGVEVLFDDRDERPGVKFADADLIGIPYHVIVGSKGLANGVVELKERRTGEVQKLKPDDVPAALQKILKQFS